MTFQHLRITQVSSSDLGGGAERVALDLHKEALNRAIDSTLAVGFKFLDYPNTMLIDNNSARSKWAQFWLHQAPSVPLPPLKLSQKDVIKRRIFKAISEPNRALRIARGYEDFDFPATSKIVDSMRPSLVNLHNLHGGYFDLRVLPELCASVPVVITAHDQWLSTGHCAYPVNCSKNDFAQRCDACPHLNYPPTLKRDNAHANFEKKLEIFKNPETKFHLVGPAEWIVHKLENSICADALIDSTVIANGVDQTVFAPVLQTEKDAIRKALNIPSNHFVCIFSVASTSSPYKDPKTIIEALSHLQDKGHLTRDITLLELGAPENGSTTHGSITVRGVPFLCSPQDVARHLQASDLYIHAARAEVLPLAIIEAQSCGIPALITNTGGATETILSEKTGRVVAQESPEELALALEDILNHEETLNGWKENTVSWARPRFDASIMAEAYFSLYERILNSKI